MRTRVLGMFLALAAAPALAGCGGSEAPANPGGGGGAAGGGPAPLGPKTLGKKMPEFTPSGMKEEYRKYQDIKSAIRNSKAKEEQAEAKKNLADFLAEFPGKWSAIEVPAPEAFMYAVVLQECKLYPQAIDQVRRWIEVAPDDSVNFVHAHNCLITCLAQSGTFDEAADVLAKNLETTYKNRDGDRKVMEETIAMAMMKAGQLERAADHFEKNATIGFGDQESAIYAVDCWLRLGRIDEAVRIANRAGDVIKEGRAGERMKALKQQVELVGRPAPGFEAAKWWKGSGGPVTPDMIKGRVTVVFVWNMKSAWNEFFFMRLNKLVKELAERDVQFVGISRLFRFDATVMGTRKDMTDEEELERYDMWVAQYGVIYPLAVGGYEDESLVNAWAAHVVPSYIVVGKDGKVSYVRTGKEEEHFAILKEMIEKALKQ